MRHRVLGVLGGGVGVRGCERGVLGGDGERGGHVDLPQLEVLDGVGVDGGGAKLRAAHLLEPRGGQLAQHEAQQRAAVGRGALRLLARLRCEQHRRADAAPAALAALATLATLANCTAFI